MAGATWLTRAMARAALALTLVFAGILPAAPVSAAGQVIYHGPTSAPVIALTFDDGYASSRCLEIADILTGFGITATWFPNGNHVRAAPDVWRSIAARFPMANHSLSHPSFVGLEASGIRRQVLENQRIIEKVTGRPMLRLLRPPFGAYDDRVVKLAKRMGYDILMWSLSAADTSPHGTDRGIAKRALQGKPGDIILMHCGPAVTPRILPVVIARYACKGFRFATVSGLLAGEPGRKARVSCPPPRLPAAPATSTRAGKGVDGMSTPAPSGSPGQAATGDFAPGATSLMPRHVAPELARFYGQTPTWTICGEDGIECASVEVPLDYDAPEADSIDIAVQRVRARARSSRGALVFDGGLPGGSDIAATLRFAASLPEALARRYDIVGFQPRGVGGSDRLTCLDRAGSDAFLAADLTPDAGAAPLTLEAVASACQANGGSLPAHVSTVEAARDLDILRAVLGRKRLDYFGVARGSFLGATYAARFPERVRHMVLEDAYPGWLPRPQLLLARAASQEQALNAYVSACIGSADCPLGGSVAEGVGKVQALLDQLDGAPLASDDPARPLTQQLGYWGIIGPLGAPAEWPTLSAALQAAFEDDGAPLLASADRYWARSPSGDGTDALDATIASGCLDDQLATGDRALPAASEFLDASPTFGAIVRGLADLRCDGWPYVVGVTAPSGQAAGARPIVIVGTTASPAAPDGSAHAFAERLDSSVVVMRRGDPQGDIEAGDACIADAIAAYYLNDEVPADGTSC